MESVRSIRPVIWSFGLLIGVLVVAGAAKAILYDTLDPDLFWHLQVADELAVQPYPQPLVDHLSFASIKTPWTPYSWLADLAIKGIWDVGGYRLAIAAQAALTAGIVQLIALITLEMTIGHFEKPRYLAAAMAVFVGEFLCLPYLSFRPVTFAILLLALAAWLLQRDVRFTQRSRAVWLVIPLTAVLSNIHLYAIFVPLAVGGLLLGAEIERRVGLHARRGGFAFRDGVRRYRLLLAGTMAACLMTPLLPGVIMTAWHYQFNDVMVAAHAIKEMRPFYQGQLGWAAAGLVLLVLGCAVHNRRRMDMGQWVWVIGSLIALVRIGRFSPVFGIFAAPTLALTLPALSDLILSRGATQVALISALAMATSQVAAAFPGSQMSLSAWINRMGPDCNGYPTGAADFIRASVPATTHRLICEFTWGGYLEWRLGDRWQVLMDGRTQLYTPDFWNTVYLGTAPARKAYLSRLTADAAVVPVKGSAFRQDLLDLGWKTAFADDRAEVLLPGRLKEAGSGD